MYITGRASRVDRHVDNVPEVDNKVETRDPSLPSSIQTNVEAAIPLVEATGSGGFLDDVTIKMESKD
jgi:hypothetical protein